MYGRSTPKTASNPIHLPFDDLAALNAVDGLRTTSTKPHTKTTIHATVKVNRTNVQSSDKMGDTPVIICTSPSGYGANCTFEVLNREGATGDYAPAARLSGRDPGAESNPVVRLSQGRAG
jgi:hypothetical protein